MTEKEHSLVYKSITGASWQNQVSRGGGGKGVEGPSQRRGPSFPESIIEKMLTTLFVNLSSNTEAAWLCTSATEGFILKL